MSPSASIIYIYKFLRHKLKRNSKIWISILNYLCNSNWLKPRGMRKKVWSISTFKTIPRNGNFSIHDVKVCHCACVVRLQIYSPVVTEYITTVVIFNAPQETKIKKNIKLKVTTYIFWKSRQNYGKNFKKKFKISMATIQNGEQFEIGGIQLRL